MRKLNTIYAKDNGQNYPPIKTRLVYYCFDLDNHTESQAWKELKAERAQVGVVMFQTMSDRYDSPRVTREVELETTHIFSNQWNTTEESGNLRVFDWHHEIVQNRRIKMGHYLEMTPEMIHIREVTFKCGYCGKQYHGANNAGKFCSACLDSVHLKIENLHLLRVVNLSNSYENRPELTDEESSILRADYITRQTRGNTSRANIARRKARADILKDYQNATKTAKIEKDGMIWLWNHGANLENVIFYPHTSQFCIGWRNPLDPDTRAAWDELMRDFPFTWEFKKN